MTKSRLGGGLALDAATQKKVARLAQRLTDYRASYYAGEPEVSDAAYDALEDELRALAPAHAVLARVGSAQAAEGWEKARHQIPMGSLNKVTDEKGLREWLARCEQLLAKEEHDAAAGPPTIADDLFVAEKLDGISLELIYRDGKLVDGITRGDGEVGERITANVVRMRGVPLTIPEKHALSVRGEIILRLSDKRQHFVDYSSPRNAAAGTARRLDGQGNQHLTVICYDVADELDLGTEQEKFELLRALGFATPNVFRGGVAEVLEVYQDYSRSRRAALDYEIDGLVVRVNQLRVQALLGDVNRRPRGAIALKFASPRKVSTVREIRWDTGPSGRVTPIAVVDPVVLASASVQRASLHNVAKVQRLGIGVGDEVLVSRRNDVIPYIEEVVTKGPNREQVPAQCGVCQAPLALEGEYLMCRNQLCPALVEGRIHNWIDAIGALEWGDKLIATLVKKGLVKEPLDLYRLKVEDIAALDRHGEKSADNALKQLHGRLPLRLSVFLAALGIEGFSTQTARLIVGAGYGDIDAVMAAGEEELAAIAGLGEIKARKIINGLLTRAEEIARLRAAGLEPVSESQAGPLSGSTFCITGSHSQPRKVLAQRIEAAGGRVVSGVNKELSYLLIGDPNSTSSKAQKARRYGTKLIDEAQLEAMIAAAAERAD